MKRETAFRAGVGRVRRHAAAGRYDRALAEAEHLLQDWPDHPVLLGRKGQMLQLQDSPRESVLDDAKAALMRAAEVDNQSPAAWIELGHFLYAVEDDAKAASECFRKAIELGNRLLADALIGQAGVFSELDRKSDAAGGLAQAYWIKSTGGGSARQNGAELLERFESLRQSG